MSKYITAKQVAILAGVRSAEVKQNPHRYPGATRDKDNRLRFEKQMVAEAFFNGDLGSKTKIYPVQVVESFETESELPGSGQAANLDIDI